MIGRMLGRSEIESVPSPGAPGRAVSGGRQLAIGLLDGAGFRLGDRIVPTDAEVQSTLASYLWRVR